MAEENFDETDGELWDRLNRNQKIGVVLEWSTSQERMRAIMIRRLNPVQGGESMTAQNSFWSSTPPTRCSRCGRRLTDPVSVSRGIGPVCRSKGGGGSIGTDSTSGRNYIVDTSGYNRIDEDITDGVRLERRGELDCWTNVPALVRHHADGFDWGYGGSGPADLALNILEVVLNRLDYQGERTQCFEGDCWDMAYLLHQKFKWAFIAPADRDCAVIPYEEIVAWIEKEMAPGAEG